MIQECVDMLEVHNLKPAVAKVFEWTDIEKAFGYLMSGEGSGKIVLKVE